MDKHRGGGRATQRLWELHTERSKGSDEIAAIAESYQARFHFVIPYVSAPIHKIQSFGRGGKKKRIKLPPSSNLCVIKLQIS